MKFIFTICLSFALLIFNRCTICSCKKVPCPAFDNLNFSQWFPYQNGEVVIFGNNAAFDTLSFSNIQKSSSYDAQQGCFNGSTGCNANCYIYSDQLSSSYNRKLQVSINTITPFQSNTSQKNIVFAFYQLNFQATDIVDTGFVLPAGLLSSKYFSTLHIAGSSFNSVQMIYKDTTADNKFSGPYKIYFAKNTGIVAYENYPDLKLWIKQ